MTAPRFDQAIPTALEVLKSFKSFLSIASCPITVVRDSFGLLCFILPDTAFGDITSWNTLAQALHKSLGSYSPGENQVLLMQSDLIDPSDILESPDRVPLMTDDTAKIWLIDRLQTNQDWLRKPLVLHPPVPTAVAFSIKGGVGRTTAFALWAWSLAREGKNVVLVDLDLEAPGVAGLLLNDDLPNYGLVDWLIETFANQADDILLQDCLIECKLASHEIGKIRVLPAFGSKTTEYISKLGRVYMPTFSERDDSFQGLADRLLKLLHQLSRLPDKPDIILLDSRAGLHDIGAAAVTRLGAEVFMFARDDYQNWQSYRQLLGYLNKSQNIALGMADDDLRWHLKMVAAQLEITEDAKLRFIDTSYTVWSELLYDVDLPFGDSGNITAKAPQIFDRNDDNAPHFPSPIYFDLRIKNFDLTQSKNRPDWKVIETAYGDFFAKASQRVFGNGSNEDNVDE